MNFEKKNLTIIIPHPDDEILGAGGTIALYSSMGWKINALVVSGHLPPLYSIEDFELTKNEYINASKIVGIDNTKFLKLPATKINEYPVSDLNKNIYNFIEETDPSILLIPFPDRHIDHRLIFESAMVSSRPVSAGKKITLVAAYETLSETHWNAPFIEPNFIPNININISDVFEKKIEALRCYKSQIDEKTSPRSIEAIGSLARFRGSQCGYEYAESYVCIRFNL